MNIIKIPELSLVALIGVSGSGKSTFASKHFKATEVISSDRCRAIVSDDENDQSATPDAFDLLHFIAAKRLKNGFLTVVDATNVQEESRRKLVHLAKEYHCLPVAIVLDLPEDVCQERNDQRSDRNFGKHVIRQQRSQLRRSLKKLKREGFRHIHILKSAEEVESITEVVREKLYNDKKEVHGPFDIIGDIHGCYEELVALLGKLGYVLENTQDNGSNFGLEVSSPEGRKVIFLGDFVDRGPASPAVLKLVMNMVRAKVAYCVPGNHDMKLQKYLKGKNVQLKHGLEKTVKQLSSESEEFRMEVKEFLYSLVSHYVFDDGKLAVAHAGIKEEMQGRGSGAVRAFCMYGETTGEIDEFGLPVRYDWASEYRGKAMVVYGHTPVPEAQWLNRTIDIDTGCVFGGKLTALRYPEEELVSVDALQVYAESARPLQAVSSSLNQQQEYDDLLDMEDVLGKRIISTRLRNNVTIREENAMAALEVMSRFAVNPKWLIYLPPTMSPTETSEHPDYLERPEEALEFYRRQGIEKVICEEKHMGSRAILVVCKDEEVAVKCFGIEGEGIGKCYTRTGRSFFNDLADEEEFLSRVNAALTKTDFWEKFDTDWVCLDAELMPWSAKAQALLQEQYASVGAAAKASLSATVEVLSSTTTRQVEGIDALLEKYIQKQEMIKDYRTAYRQYCWPVKSIADYKLAPFHILATEEAVHMDKSHEWHMQHIQEICQGDEELLMATPYRIVDFSDEKSQQALVHWWEDLTEKGGEGIVIKPLDFVSHGKKGVVQPAIKCRGREYLRIIYGPEYTAPEHLARLKKRGLSSKRSLAMREFALGLEGLERFVKKEPLRRIHECVFGVLALESEPIDPRL
ncbi:protein phosphatase [Catalinimonas alkaloidigena]|uniref:polynucleotide kinase-phosphatase n=1 Tax=Catalinimonas alkaloidigena TaxID=1075417 RepID=UPI002404A9E7|nr:polynucleotide kinase-phosphatase [Catalinimonas alkaloidigena]MDF9794984.1 protein phosphatase [Catalinimonas alkaloidigena]